PLFTTRAVDAGVAAIFAFPLQAGTTPLGAMNLYRVRPGRLSPEQLTSALAVADLVAQAVLALQRDAPAGALAAGLANVSFRAVVHQATGMIAAQLGVGVAEALVRLRSFAYAEDRSVDDMADMVVARTLRFDGQVD
ncbi:MAG: ANTAR domain-containing protein, partial [Acidimicrobiia bacterium]